MRGSSVGVSLVFLQDALSRLDRLLSVRKMDRRPRPWVLLLAFGLVAHCPAGCKSYHPHSLHLGPWSHTH